MQFIIGQQGQFAFDIQQLKKIQMTQQAQFSSAIHELMEVQAKSVEDIKQLREAETTLMRAVTATLGMVGETNA